jgi:hypothetical protein
VLRREGFERCNCLRSCLGETFEGFERRGPLVSHRRRLRPRPVRLIRPYEASGPAFGALRNLAAFRRYDWEEMGFASTLLPWGLECSIPPYREKRPSRLFITGFAGPRMPTPSRPSVRLTRPRGVRSCMRRYDFAAAVQSIRPPMEIRIKRSKGIRRPCRIAKDMDRPLLDVKKELDLGRGFRTRRRGKRSLS